MRKLIATVALVMLLTGSFHVSSASVSPKLTDRASKALDFADSDFPQIYWVFLDNNAVADEPIFLTDKARQRRAKVDPVDFLVDSLDYPISEEALTEIENTGVVIRHASRWLRAVSVYTNAQRLGALAALPFVKQIDLISIYKTRLPRDITTIERERNPESAGDFLYGGSLAQHQFIRSDRLHILGLTGKGVMIAVLDTGFDTDHPAFDTTSILVTHDFIHGDSDVTEIECTVGIAQNYHGTAVLGILGANAPNNLIGVAPGADYILAKTEISCGDTEIKLEEDNWIAAAEWADSIGADIITSSLGYHTFNDSGSYTFDHLNGDSALITFVADMAASKNILVVTSAGNSRGHVWNHISMPADGDSVLAVGAVYDDGLVTTFSSPGPTADGRIKPDVVTLGVGVWLAIAEPSRGYNSGNGTSFSAPLVAGGAALAIEHDPFMTAHQLLERIRLTSNRSSNPDNDYGYGLFDAFLVSGIPIFYPVDTIRVEVGEIRTISITTYENPDSVQELSVFDLPHDVEFIDLRGISDTLALLTVTGSDNNPPTTRFGLAATTAVKTDTLHITLETYGISGQGIFAGPNPFTDSVWFFTKPIAGDIRSVSVFNSAGEKVWELVNNFDLTADRTKERGMAQWNGRNLSGEVVAAGVYLVYVETNRQSAMLKLLKLD